MILFLIISSILIFEFLNPIFSANEIIITYGIEPFDICSKIPELWYYIKIIYVISFIFSNLIYSNFIYSKISKITKIKKKKIPQNIQKYDKLNLLIGYDEKTKENIYVPESGLYQNFLITGTIGSGKTSSAMYPFTQQLLKYNSINKDKKIGMLILDVKGNFYKQVKEYAQKYNLLDDLIIIQVQGKQTYNPLDKPKLKPAILANRLRVILELFSENNSESYWLDKAEQVLAESIKLCRLYNKGYVDFKEIHKLIMNSNYYKEKIQVIKTNFEKGEYAYSQIYDLNSALEFFQNEFEKLDVRTMAILKSEITRITNNFISDYDISKTFCPKREEQTFKGFREVINKGKIVVLNMNITEYSSLSKIIAAYLKLDFQSEIISSLSRKNQKTTAFICDEYAEYVTKTDSNFFSLSREAKCINIVSTQSYSSIINTLKDETVVKVICQNLINKIWFRTDDIFTIEEIQKQLGKEEKIKTSKNVSESAQKTMYNYLTHSLNSKDSNISESFNVYTQTDYKFDTNFFTQNLETFTALAFLSDGNKIINQNKIKMFPYFLNNN